LNIFLYCTHSFHSAFIEPEFYLANPSNPRQIGAGRVQIYPNAVLKIIPRPMAAGQQWKAPAWQWLCALCRACSEWPEPLLQEAIYAQCPCVL
jgi:hypothetical protein